MRPKRLGLPVRLLAAPAHSAPIDVIYRTNYDTFTGQAKPLTGNCMTFKYIESTFGRVLGNKSTVLIHNNTG